MLRIIERFESFTVSQVYTSIAKALTGISYKCAVSSAWLFLFTLLKDVVRLMKTVAPIRVALGFYVVHVTSDENLILTG